MNNQPIPTNIVAMREFMRERFPEAHAHMEPESEPVRTGLSLLDGLGLGKGAVTEVVGTQAGIGLLIACLLERETAVWEPTALVDGCDAFDPWSVPPNALERLLWLRCRETEQAVKATDLLLRDGNIPLVLLDLQLHPLRTVQGMPSSVWHRLRLLAEKSGCTLCVLTPGRAIPCARSRVMLESRFTLADQHEEHRELAAKLRLRTDRQPQAVLGSAPAWKAIA
ncbi:MAG: hypothetical protein JWO08_3938 [Verrucomicrobiaceae bacterium]|nr:hypothetical protein [Verrucomicrobiaceae bacterium]